MALDEVLSDFTISGMSNESHNEGQVMGDKNFDNEEVPHMLKKSLHNRRRMPLMSLMSSRILWLVGQYPGAADQTP